MADDFKRAQSQSHRGCPGGFSCRLDGPDDKPAVRKRARAKLSSADRQALKVSEADMRAFAYEWREEFEWLSKN